MEEKELKEIFAHKKEKRWIEFKEPGKRTNKHFFAKVVRAMLGMSNKRDGGYVIIGVSENRNQFEPLGLDAEQLSTWNYDDIASSLANYVDPQVDFDVEVVAVDGEKYVVLTTFEFEEIPVICKKDYPEVLKNGACYVRGRRKIETIEVSSNVEMRELIDLSVDKSFRRFLQRLHHAGFMIPSIQVSETDDEKYNEQLGDL